MRIGELKGIKWRDIDWDAKTLRIQRQHVPGVKMNEDLTFSHLGEVDLDHVKAYEQARLLPLNEEALRILKQIQNLAIDEEYVFPLRRNTYTDKILQAVAFARGIPAYLDDGKRNPELADIHPHSLRVTAGTAVFAKSSNIKVAQAFLGHSNPDMTNRYIKGLDEFNALKAVL